MKTSRMVPTHARRLQILFDLMLGMEREFVGRLPVRVALQALSKEDLFQVLTTLGTVLEGSADWFPNQNS